MVFVYLVVLAVGGYLLYGFVVPSRYQRRFSQQPEVRVADGYIRPKEITDADETALAGRVSAMFVSDTARRPRGAGAKDRAFHEPHWGHTTGIVRGELQIDDVGALPEQFRVGLFQNPDVYPAVCRVNYTHDTEIKLTASRLAIKLKWPGAVPNVYADDGVADELDLLVAEGSSAVDGPGHEFFFRDAREADLLASLKPPRLASVKTLANWRNLRILATVLKRLKRGTSFGFEAPATQSGWAGKSYYSLGPFALGSGAMKFCFRPRQTHPISQVDPRSEDPTGAHRSALEDWQKAGQDARFDLCVQLATDTCLPEPTVADPPKDVMAAEYCDVHWDEVAAPYVRVGTLTLSAAENADLSETPAWSSLQFNAWNTLDVMRPLGQLFRIRKHVHKAHSEVRMSHLHDVEPGSMVGKAPFAETG